MKDIEGVSSNENSAISDFTTDSEQLVSEPWTSWISHQYEVTRSIGSQYATTKDGGDSTPYRAFTTVFGDGKDNPTTLAPHGSVHSAHDIEESTNHARVGVHRENMFIPTYGNYYDLSGEANLGTTDSRITSYPCDYAELMLWDIQTLDYHNCSNFTNFTLSDSEIIIGHPGLGALLSAFAVITVFGNLLVMIAVARERYLRTVTNYFVVSLAIADVIIGAAVMPFSIVLEMTNQIWLFGHDWCDVWHSFDVLASTASILNLSVISLDRYWAITDPITYPCKMSIGRAMVLIALVWICSAGISFPAILWWREVAIEDAPAHVCAFTDDTVYLILSSMISFYCPVAVIMFAYFKIYRAATEQIRSFKTGSKVMATNGSNGEVMTLRIHRGGGGRRFSDESYHYTRAANSDSDNDSPSHHFRHCREEPEEFRPSRMISRTWKHFAISRKLSKIAKERKAAKTLGIVMGIFCVCWVPFFVANLLFAFCKTDCVPHADIVFPVFTWLGYINSGMNPVIYACSMKDFRRAFSKILLSCCPFMYMKCKRDYYSTPVSASYSNERYSATIKL